MRHPVLADHDIRMLAPDSSVFVTTAEISASRSGIYENSFFSGMLPNIPDDSTFIHDLLPTHPFAISL
jgi:hypothetical protein